MVRVRVTVRPLHCLQDAKPGAPRHFRLDQRPDLFLLKRGGHDGGEEGKTRAVKKGRQEVCHFRCERHTLPPALPPPLPVSPPPPRLLLSHCWARYLNALYLCAVECLLSLDRVQVVGDGQFEEPEDCLEEEGQA